MMQPVPSPVMSATLSKSATSSSSSRKRPASVPTSVRKGKKVSDPNQKQMVDLAYERFAYERQYKATELHHREKELEYREKELQGTLQVSAATAAKLQEDREISVATAAKVKEEAKIAAIAAKAALLRERKKLLDEGVNPDEVDIMFPLPTHL